MTNPTKPFTGHELDKAFEVVAWALGRAPASGPDLSEGINVPANSDATVEVMPGLGDLILIDASNERGQVIGIANYLEGVSVTQLFVRYVDAHGCMCERWIEPGGVTVIQHF